MYMSKTELRTKIRMLIKDLGVTPSLKATQHYDFFKEVVARHPKAFPEPLDLGIRKNALYKSLEVFGVWHSGTYPVSMEKCVNMKEPSVKAQFYEAMRNSINDQVLAFRLEQTDLSCVFCSSTENPEVDHVVMLKHLISEFMHTREMQTQFDRNRGSSVILKPGQFCTDWQAFHAERATFRMLCQECNGKRNIT
jgi:hypothetical protein